MKDSKHYLYNYPSAAKWLVQDDIDRIAQVRHARTQITPGHLDHVHHFNKARCSRHPSFPKYHAVKHAVERTHAPVLHEAQAFGSPRRVPLIVYEHAPTLHVDHSEEVHKEDDCETPIKHGLLPRDDNGLAANKYLKVHPEKPGHGRDDYCARPHQGEMSGPRNTAAFPFLREKVARQDSSDVSKARSRGISECSDVTSVSDFSTGSGSDTDGDDIARGQVRNFLVAFICVISEQQLHDIFDF